MSWELKFQTLKDLEIIGIIDNYNEYYMIIDLLL